MGYRDLLNRCAEAVKRVSDEETQERSSAQTLARFYREHEDVEHRYPSLNKEERCDKVCEDILTFVSLR